MINGAVFENIFIHGSPAFRRLASNNAGTLSIFSARSEKCDVYYRSIKRGGWVFEKSHNAPEINAACHKITRVPTDIDSYKLTNRTQNWDD